MNEEGGGGGEGEGNRDCKRRVWDAWIAWVT